jgi:arylsulfatase A-like enzyme
MPNFLAISAAVNGATTPLLFTPSVRKGDYKLIKFQDDKSILLFNLVKDKMEQLNLATQKPEKVKELEKILDNYLTEVHAPKWQDGITWKNTPLKEINSNY